MTVDNPPARRPAHRLTDRQRRAFERLGVLGADLPAGFTSEELRREYRGLARRFHPDRHGDCSEMERQQRARNFAEAAESYSCLRALVETRH